MITRLKEIAPHALLRGGRLTHTLKNVGTFEKNAKARLIAQEFDRHEKPFTVCDTETLQESSIHLVVLAAVQHKFRLFSHDASQEYLRLEQRLSGYVHICVVAKGRETLEASNDKLLKVNNPFYGICNTGENWGILLDEHTANSLGMIPTMSTPALSNKIT